LGKNFRSAGEILDRCCEEHVTDERHPCRFHRKCRAWWDSKVTNILNDLRDEELRGIARELREQREAWEQNRVVPVRKRKRG
jgi:hypothetical protein